MKTLKRFFKLFFDSVLHLASNELSIKNRTVRLFDLVKFIGDPETKAPSLIYRIDDDCVWFVGMDKYLHDGNVSVTEDNLLMLTHDAFEQNAIKVIDTKLKYSQILIKSSENELNSLITRFGNAFYIRPPLMGVFVDNRDDHLMLVTCVDDNDCTVLDVTVAKTYGVFHTRCPAYVVKKSELLDNQVFKPLDAGLFKSIFDANWSMDVVDNLVESMFNAIRVTETKFINKDIICKGVALAQSPKTPEQNKDKKEKVKS